MVAIAKWLTSMMCWIDRQLLLMLFLGWRLVVSADLLTLAASLQAHQIFHQLISMLHWRRMPLIMLKLILLLACRSTCFRVILTFRLCEKPCLMLARRPVDVASIVESASFSEIPGHKSLLSQAVNEALSSVDDGKTARAIENRLLEEQAAQLLSRGDRQVYQSEIANSQRIIDNLTEQRAQILAEEPTGSGKALSRARSDKQARIRDIDQRIRQAQERLEFSRNALAPHEPGGQFFEARAELARRQQAESELNAQAVSFYKTAEVRTPDEVAPFEPGKILQQTEQKMMADPAGDIDLRIAEDSLLESPDMIITVLDDDGNPQSRSAREVLDEANRESEQAIQDSSLFDVAVACFLRG